jgi:broad specificity phosphatase PhoE
VSAPRLLVVRHGESIWNAEGRWQGQADPPLSTLGERQAEAAATGIDEPLAAIWTSDLARARRTAEIIAGRLGIDPPNHEPRLRERDAGEWSGFTRAEIEERWPGALAADRRPPGWEPDDQLAERTLAALHDIGAASVEGTVTLIVTHGGVIRTLERELGAEPEPVPNLGGRWIVAVGTALELGERRLLIDPDDIEVTVPPPR